MKRITVRQYMTKHATPEFNFMAQWNNDNPMPLRTMVGTVEKETRGMVYMALHGDIYASQICTCMKCGKALTNPVSQYFGIGPECGGHNYVNPFDSEDELKEAVSAYRAKLQQVTWEGWIIKSAITEEEVLSDEERPVTIKEAKKEEVKKNTVTMDIKPSTKCNSKYSVYLTFAYDSAILAKIRELPFRYWNAEAKQWEVPVDQLDELKAIFKNYDITVTGAEVLEEKKQEQAVDFEFKTRPYEHQVEGFTYGLTHDRWLLADEQGLGKALALDTKVYTPIGYKLMKDIQVGDYVFGKDGKPTKVTAIYNHSNVEMYRITFSDGVSIDCCKDHLWQIHDQHGTKVVDTKWFTEKDQFNRVRKDNLFSSGSGSYKYWIDRCEPVQFEYQNTPVDPYVLGALLGDGCLTSNSIGFTTADKEMVDNINERLREGYTLHSSKSMSDIDYNIVGIKGKVNTVKKDLSDLGLWGTTSHTKFIPDIYKYNSISVRTEVLQGLIDTDGYASKDNLLAFATVSKQLCEDVRFLVESLGGTVSYSESDCSYNEKITGRCYTLTIKFDRPQLYCTLTRKKSLLKDRHFKTRRNIVSVERIKNADAKCITVDNAEHLYLIDHFVVTHNTKQVIDIAVALKQRRGYKHCLIVCGVNGLKWNWMNEIRTHSDEAGYILGQRQRAGKLVIGSTSDKNDDLRRLNSIGEYFIVTNIESLRNDEICAQIEKYCKSGDIGLIAVDEVHKCKNPSSQQGKALLKLKSEYRIAMTGTPLMNNPLDLYVILKWLGYEDHAFYSFRNHYCVMGGYGGHEIVGYRNMEELESKITAIMLRRKKAEVLDLPEKVRVLEYVDMLPKQAQIYKEVTADIKANIDQIKMASNPLAELIRMRQATGYTGILSSTIQESAKLDRMEELVEEAVESGKKVVIFSNWTQMTTPIMERLCKKYYCVKVTGEYNTEAREAAVREFQTNDRCTVIIGTIGAMGTGLNLFEGSVIIFVDHPWTRAAYDQAVDRCHRIGQKNNLLIYDLVCHNTIDEKILNLIDKKGAVSDWLIDNKTLDKNSDLLNYLIG